MTRFRMKKAKMCSDCRRKLTTWACDKCGEHVCNGCSLEHDQSHGGSIGGGLTKL